MIELIDHVTRKTLRRVSKEYMTGRCYLPFVKHDIEMMLYAEDGAVQSYGMWKNGFYNFVGRYNNKTGMAIFYAFEKQRKQRGWNVIRYDVPLSQIVYAKQYKRHCHVVVKSA